LTDSALPVAEVAYASGFASVRRFNDVFQQHYRMSPSALRKNVHADTAEAPPAVPLSFELSYRPPYAWDALLDFLGKRAIAGVEQVGNGVYARSVSLVAEGRRLDGWIEVTHRPARHAVVLRFPPTLAHAVAPLLYRVRHLFDLACRPDLVDAHLGALAAELPGLRVPGAFDGFEIAVRAIVGQQISVAGARTMLGRIAEHYGRPLPLSGADERAPMPPVRQIFPDAATLAALPPDALRAIGMIGARAATIHALATEIASGRLNLAPLVPIEATLAALKQIKGIGDWTAHYIALRALAWPNAFPAGDLVLRQQLNLPDARAVERHAQQWAPWRAYAALHLWRRAAEEA
jgi:AraC family transcriptional regulator, regulatory protein of adaptative response / DNA-3-methyladenine glycosylase II